MYNILIEQQRTLIRMIYNNELICIIRYLENVNFKVVSCVYIISSRVREHKVAHRCYYKQIFTSICFFTIKILVFVFHILMNIFLSSTDN